MVKLLFVCSRNRWRSPTAERVFRDREGVDARSAGTSPKAKRRISERDLDWADLIFVMEKKHRTMMVERFGHRPNVIVLGIPDEYELMDPELVEMLHQQVEAELAERFEE